MENELIVIKQLPVIEDQLAAVRESITQRVSAALLLVCTEETYKDVKKVRSELNKEYAELETRRKEVKAAILGPYEHFEKVYKECAGDIYKNADLQLKGKIDEVEKGLKKQKEDALLAYFNEYRESLGIPVDFVALEAAGIKVGLSDSLASMKKAAKGFLDHIDADLKVIYEHADRDEIMTEYQREYDLGKAMSAVNARHKAIEDARRAREEAEALRVARADQQAEIAAAIAAQTVPIEAVAAPVATPVMIEETDSVPAPAASEAAQDAEKMYTLRFTVTDTLEKLKALKRFLVEGGYHYE